jgi:putative DNA primase/helicase
MALNAQCQPPLATKEVQGIVASARQQTTASANSLVYASGRTDNANAARLVTKFGEVIKWVGPWEKWLIWWDGKRWKTDDSLRIQGMAKEVADDLWAEAAAAAKAGNLDKFTVAEIFAWAYQSNNVGRIRAMIALARSDVPVSVDQLDRDPWLLNITNGTLDLQTGELREHRREDFITKLAPVAFDQAASCPAWQAFLDVIFARDALLIDYMRRLVGYSLTGRTVEHMLPFLHGTGANGKSTFCETILTLLGPDYAMKAPRELLMAKQGERHPTELADLHGKRFVACVETEEGRRLAETAVKELTGGDTIKARRMREDFWSFAATHKLWLAGNHKPAILGTDHGIWRRIKLIPFEVVIPEDRQDKHLKDKLAGELPGILNWALAGCLEWQRGGMQEPPIVSNATQSYQAESDEVGQFIVDRCEIGKDFDASAADLWEAFQRDAPDSKLTQTAFADRLRHHGCSNRDPATGKVYRPRGIRSWKGLRLRTVVPLSGCRV